ncbi:MAG: nicotinamide-nucleotide amidohydrolase family protein [Euryarchaeota archaeon]|jgi:nicotinamide-nucleotide amidase|nr:nicotinamide-nucleotide amidohydrolase family protein [Euryarchaeota archaeon]MBT5844551.1 nicotinamide-nucleotide amidohydrolase family protein [Euryarchaeota archaeon]MBT6640882.1 nicotinamide-nucleotide amidohydrolase family protein [Euryarchaeota archaeon]MBT7263633.1 nicotinamide-nucleotide amidohydrolase family protein [Euryarchaeota archaeon]MBT7638095.1 nicotinamide-nucleotide amidohydrolase family protein [Euryarchaeota archaeon]
MDEDVQAAAARLVRRIKEGGHTITVAESCTGGLLASSFTDIAGASTWFNQAWVTYSNDAKIKELNVKPESIEKKGAVSAEVAIQMAKGALERADADIAISITGIAGPKNDGTNKKVGLVYVGIASNNWANAESTQIGGNRAENKIGFVHFALLSTIKRWDVAMVEAENHRKELERQKEELEAERIQFELDRAKREEAARESAPWQDDAWDGEGAPPGGESSFDDEVQWD